MRNVASPEDVIADEAKLSEEDRANLKLLQGMVWGALAEMAATMSTLTSTRVEMEDDSVGNHTGRVLITKPSGRYIVTVVKIPEEE